MKDHRYEATVRWTGAREGTTSADHAYSREHAAVVEGKTVLRLSAGGDLALAEELLQRSHDLCFIARSVNFPVRHEPEVAAGAAAAP